MSLLILPDPADVLAGADLLTREQEQARADGLTPCCFTVYLRRPQDAAAVQLEAEQWANLLNSLPTTPPQPAQAARQCAAQSLYPGRAAE